jgi:hypothetical protein
MPMPESTLYCVCSAHAAPLLVPVSPSAPAPFAPQRDPPGRPGPLASTDCLWPAEARMALPSVPQCAALAVSQLPQCLQGLRTVWKQGEAACLLPPNDDAATVDEMINPGGFAPPGRGQLRHGEAPGNAPGTRPAGAMPAPVPQAKRLDRAGQHPWPRRGANPLRWLRLGDGRIGVTRRLQAESLRLPLRKPA